MIVHHQSGDRDRLLAFARQWFYEHRYIIIRAQDLRSMVAAATRPFEMELSQKTEGELPSTVFSYWRYARRCYRRKRHENGGDP